LRIRKNGSEITHRLTRSSLHYLAYAYNRVNRKSDATDLYKEAADAHDYLAIRELARCYRMDRKYDDAEKLEKQLLGVADTELQRDFYEYGRIDFTPLHHAVWANDINSIKNRTNEYKEFVNIGDEDGRTPLHHAAEQGLVEIVELLLAKCEVNIDLRN